MHFGHVALMDVILTFAAHEMYISLVNVSSAER